MEELDEVIKELNWRERIIFKIHKKMFRKFYNIIRINFVNSILK